MTDSISTSPLDSAADTAELRSQLRSGSEKTQLQLLQQHIADAGWDVLMEFLLERKSEEPTAVMGKAYQILYCADSARAREFLQANFPTGVVQLRSDSNIDYTPLQQLLALQEFQEADLLTLNKLCGLAGETAAARKWLYFTEVESLPMADLQTINTLWKVHSENKFGFSVQREIWLSSGKNWDKLWPLIGWKKGNNWTRYPQEFIWDLSAPRGHLPLSNQLRGVQPFAALMAHRAWVK
ncbi:MAG: GUN4 N-terminal ARM-like repeat domain-containing protein [Microcoleus sp. PH2017_39_LGB_O_B]|uniref:GUN4 domain-containing protein n=1 Tax=unclassified Microcoleus TaxID=2642155 RepID=UPI001D81D645|nr:MULTISPECIES: GUN4 domain-containing protein [unclassified Microcoleus]TAE67834.1 MAG: GUN4 domain-containing protein [Oscillatoriales cyanobacterium]MCC3448189.1 GUN4 N-terminal ARM-like repeat domain-containing protein [Microcoleus sp. PH2017_09_SFU_O_A]MCC3629128.1 GUN4 N-terminal ARM-like repeat domain-containing protein [Microcoleus sp. PH2017_39_LGB_O_B]MCC3641212.1 GUN4 N-terminal ARM-like repeat domain-containing protein [Microcoleus sp. PH2017_33_LGB_O_A]TAF86208.1 MAG: GUN4 domain